MNQSFQQTVEVLHKGNYDVIVAGGGIAGSAAALAAARRGRSVLLVDKMVTLGGLATNGLVVHYNHSLCDRKGRRVIGGISEEILHATVKYGSHTLPPEWKLRTERVDTGSLYRARFSAPALAVALDELLEGAGVQLLVDTVCCGVDMTDGLCKGVFMENKEGRVYFGCKQLIDTTGDLDLFKRAGAPCAEDLNWLSYLIMQTDMDRLKACVEKGDIGDLIDVRTLGTDRDGLRNPAGVRRYTVETGEELTKFVTRGRAYLREYLAKADLTREMVVAFPSQAQYRTTRHLLSDYIMDASDKDRHHEDSVGCACTYRENGFFLEIPYRTLYSKGYPNMLTAGRTIAADGIAREITRLIAPGAVTGEAAGIAAAMALERSCSVCDLPVSELQREIVAAEGILHV
jgi:hypothetical protein